MLLKLFAMYINMCDLLDCCFGSFAVAAVVIVQFSLFCCCCKCVLTFCPADLILRNSHAYTNFSKNKLSKLECLSVQRFDARAFFCYTCIHFTLEITLNQSSFMNFLFNAAPTTQLFFFNFIVLLFFTCLFSFCCCACLNCIGIFVLFFFFFH